MIQVGDLVKHRHYGGLGLVKQLTKTNYSVTSIAYQATIAWLVYPHKDHRMTVLWTKDLVKSETK